MDPRTWLRGPAVHPHPDGGSNDEDRSPRLYTDGGEPEDESGGQAEDSETNRGEDGESETDAEDGNEESGPDGEDPGAEQSSVEVTEAGEAEPADPEWDRPDPDDIPEFEIRGGPTTAGKTAEKQETGPTAGNREGDSPPDDHRKDPTAGRPNTARSPGQSRIRREGTEGYIVALELCARLPDEVRLPEEAADLVPAAVEAELEEDVQSFAAAEFDDHSPHVDTLSFVEADDEVWLRIRIGISPDAFADLDPEEIRTYALQELEGLL